MPLRAVPPAASARGLSPGDIEFVGRAAASIGFRKARLTGGEPTLRADLVEIVQRLSRIAGIADVAMTTNGILLPKLAGPLKKAGLSRVNVHLDTLHRERLPQIMRFATWAKIWAGIEAAEEAGLTPLKINAVVTRDFNDQDTAELAALTLRHPWHVRFIELMPLGRDGCADVARGHYCSNQETRKRIENALGPLSPAIVSDPSSDSSDFQLPGARGLVGFISPVSMPFCETCNRMRLTSGGRLHLCLLNPDDLDASAAIRNRDFRALRDLLGEAVRRKPTGHRLDGGISNRECGMFQLGG